MYSLLTTFFDSANAERQDELRRALVSNCASFDAVYVYAENCEKPDWFSGYWLNHDRKKFCDLFSIAAEMADPDDITVIANSDISFPSLSLIYAGESIQADQVYCLSRWDFVPDKGCTLFDRADSQDSWIFRGTPNTGDAGDYFFGMPGCDNKIAYELSKRGYKVLNPSREIVTLHTHRCGLRLSNRREWRVPLPYLLVTPHKIGEQPEYQKPRRLSKRAGCFQV